MSKPIEAIYVAVGARFRMVRETLGMTQDEMAKRLEMSRPSLANIEVGRQRLMLHDIEKMSRALNMSPKAILKGIWW